MQRPYVPQRPERQSLMEKHGWTTIFALVGAVALAGILAIAPGIREAVCDPLPFCGEKELDSRLIGSWEFVRFEPREPEQRIPGVTDGVRSITIYKNQSYIAVYTQTFDDGTVLENQTSGKYEANNSMEAKFLSNDEANLLGVHTFRLEGNLMYMTNTATRLTIVFEQV